nr:hypothetical protein [Nitrospirota bacterium]
MRCPQCGGITLATTQTRGIATAYCEDCAQWWEWVSRPNRSAMSGREKGAGGRWVVRVAAGPPQIAGKSEGGRSLQWRGRLLQEAREAKIEGMQPVSTGA